MRAAADSNDYRDNPTDAFIALPRALAFCARPTLWGFALWGRPAPADLTRIVPLLKLELAATPHASLIDLHRLEASDPRTLGVLSRYLRANSGALRKRVTRLAVVRSPGATIAGLDQVPCPMRVFDTLPEACAWVRAPALAKPLDAAIASASKPSPLILQLRRWLDAHLENASLARAAKAISRSTRSLQRDLGDADTTFQGELDAARIRLAKRLLSTTDSPLTEIAYDIGCASPQHFSTLFRRVMAMTPSEFRGD